MRKASQKAAAQSLRPPATISERLFGLATGCWIAIALMKFGNPIIFDEMIAPPRNLAEVIFTPWPIFSGYALFAVVLLSGLRFIRPTFDRRHWPIAALGFWLLWQFLSSARTVDPKLTNPTLVHFVTCVLTFLLGWWAFPRARHSKFFWVPVLLGFTYTLLGGFDQHYGGLEATRQSFYEQPNWQMYPKEFILKMQSTRIFSTLVYPNTFAGVILLLFPIAFWKLWEISAKWQRIARLVSLGVFAYMAAGCLYWTGSKGGWLVALFMSLVLVLHLRLPKTWKVAIIAGSLVLGLTAFFVRFSGYFQKGATSVSARFEYWRAGVHTAKEHPILGTGPGTFQIAYRQIKPPDAEMAKLTHNDYLEQASDSGLPGAIAYALFIFGSLAILYRYREPDDWVFLLIWLGLLGWAVQAFIEFSLYIPAIAWPVFLFFGMLWSKVQKGVISETV